MPVFNGTSAPNTITGSSDDDVINGLQNNDNLSGLDGDDVLNGDEHDDTLNGGAGNDTLNGGDGNDIATYATAANGVTVSLLLQGAAQDTIGAGNDTLNSIERLIGSAYNDILTGDAGNNSLTGGAGDDTLVGGDGADQLTGGAGNDTLNGGSGNDAVSYTDATAAVTVNLNIQGVAQDTGGGGIDTLIDIDSAFGGAFNDTLTGNDGNNSLSGGSAGDDVLIGGAGDDSLQGLSGNDTLDGGEGVDNANYAGATAAVTVSLLLQGAAQDTGGNGLDTLTEIENLTGSRFNDTLTGDAGANRIDGGVGNDLIDGGGGNDTVSFLGSATSAYIDLAEGRALGNSNNPSVSNSGSDTLIGIENVVGTLYSDYIVGDGFGNQLSGMDGHDEIHGEGGDDLIIGGAGGDTLYGNGGNDVIYADGDGYVNTDYFNELNGDAGDDTLYGGLGNDWLLGGEGDDVLDSGMGVEGLGVFHNSLYGDDGIDTVSFGSFTYGVTFVLPSDHEYYSFAPHLAVRFYEMENVSGTAYGDDLTGDANGNRLSGLAGDDSLDGALGDDVLVGGAGADQIEGGAGEDRVVLTGASSDYLISLDGDVVTLTDKRAGANDGNDTVSGVEQFEFSDRTLSFAELIPHPVVLTDDRLTITRGVASDLLAAALLANDDVNFDSTVQSVSNAVGATVSLLNGRLVILATGATASFDYTVSGPDGPVTAHVAIDTVVATTGADTLAAAPTATAADLQGGNNNDILTGSDGDDRLVGGAGNDTLSGGPGHDELIGGAGLDTYLVTSLNVVIVELANGGADIVRASVDYVLDENLENLVLLGDALNGTGNTLVNRLTGNDGNNILDGGAGVDFLDGGLGDDTYVIDNIADKITDTGGIDTVRTTLLAYTLAAGLENLTYLGSGSFYGKGNAAANILTGGDGSDRLESVGGNDTMIGGFGDDSYYVASMTDTIIENPDNTGADYIYSKVNYVMAENNGIENLRIWGAGAVNLTGNSQGQSIVGNDNRNVLDGGGGSDLLVGLGGDDTYILRNAIFSSDVIEAAGGGYDTALVYFTGYWIVADNVEKAVLMGTATQLIGNALNNLLVGNALNNSLIGGLGADTMQGGAGDDTYNVDNAGDVVQDTSGIDKVIVVAAITYTLAAGIENVEGQLYTATPITVTGNTLANTMTGQNGNDTFYGLAGHDSLIGGDGLDRLEGGDGNDILTGGTGDDTLVGGAGHDRLDGGQGGDSLTGGLGNDSYIVDSADDLVIEAAGGGMDAVYTNLASYTLAAEIENYVFDNGHSGFTGTGNALGNTMSIRAYASGTLLGLDGADTLNGGTGNDTLNGGSGYDRLIGGGGEDRLWGGGTEKDIFVFNSISDSRQWGGDGPDRIMDFDIADVIDLRGIDANTAVAGDQAFSFIGAAAFSGVAGQLRLSTAPDHIRIQGDVDGNGYLDFEVIVMGAPKIIAPDFLL